MADGGAGPESGQPPKGSPSGTEEAGSSAELLLQCRRRYRDVHERARGLQAIMGLSAKISSHLDLDTILDEAMNATVLLTGAERGYLVLKDEEDKLSVSASFRFEASSLGHEDMAYSRSVVMYTVRSGESVLSTNASHDDRFAQATSVKMMNLRAVMASPIRSAKGEPIGAIYVDDPFHSGRFNKRALRLLEGFADQVSVAIQTAKLHEHLVREKVRLQQMEVARTVQRSLIPRSAPEIEGLDVGWIYRPAYEIGGDMFQFLTLADGNWATFIADVAGKGVPAALVMSKLHEACKMIAKHTSDPMAFLSELNATLCEDTETRIMVTASLVVWEAGGDSVKLVRAGHCPMGVVRTSSEEHFEWHQPSGLLLGALREDWGGMCETAEVPLGIGDGVLLFTDGVSEAMDTTQEEYGFERVKLVAERGADAGAEDLVARLLADIQEFAGEAEQSDDITIVYVRRTMAPRT